MPGENLGTIWSSIGIDYTAYQQGVDHIARQNTWLDVQTQRAMDNISQHYTKMGKALSVAVTAPLTLMARQWVNTFADFQQAMANTQSVIGATTEELELLTAAARRAGEETVFKASEAADALYNLGQAGMSAAQSIDALDGVLTLATATQSDLAFTAEVISASLSQFGLEAREATRVANLFAAANAESLASIDKLAASMKYVGPVAASFGYSIEETTAALMGLYNAGFAGEQAGTTLRRALSELANPTGDAANVIKELGLTINDLHPEMNSLADIIDTLNQSGITTTQTMRMFGQAAGPGMSTLISLGGDAIRGYTENITGTNKAAEQAAIQLNTLSGDIKMLQSVYESLRIEVTSNFEPALRSLVQQFTELLAWIRDLNPETQRLLVTMGGFAAAAGPIMLIISQLLKALPILMGPTGLIYGGVAALTALALSISSTERDMRAFYQQSIDNSRAAEQQANELRKLVDEYKELSGKPDLSEQEHRRLETVMKEIIRIQPDLAKGYQTIDEAIKANISTLETYISTLETQSELQLRVASLEYMRTRNQLEYELNQLLEERAQKEAQIEGRLEQANRLANWQNEIQGAFVDWLEAIEKGSDDAAKEAEDTMRRILLEWQPDHVVRDWGPVGLWGKWVEELRRDAERASSQTGGLLSEIDKISARIAELQDEQAYAQAVFDELERRRAGIPLPATTQTTSASAPVRAAVQEVQQSVEDLEEVLSNEMELYRARIELVRHAGDQYAQIYGDIETVHQRYIDWLNKNVYDRHLQVSEQFRAMLAVELGKIKEAYKELGKEDTVDPNTAAISRMQVFRAELSLLRLNVDAYVQELGGLERHLERYAVWLEEQLTNTGLSEITHAQIAETRAVIEEELENVRKLASLTAESVWQSILGIIDSYGPMADRLREALEGGRISIDAQDLEKTAEHIRNYYEYLVATQQISLVDQVAVLEYQIRNAVAGSREWLELWNQKLLVQRQIEAENQKVEKEVARQNEALQKQLELFEQLRHVNDETVDSYEKQAEWLTQNVLQTEGILRTDAERRQIENEIFALRMSHYQRLAQVEGWNTKQSLEHLQEYVGVYATSFEQLMAVSEMQIQLAQQVRREEETNEQQRLQTAQQVSNELLDLEVTKLRNMGQLREADELEAYARLQRELQAARDNAELIELAYARHTERMIEIDQRYTEESIQNAQDLAQKTLEVSIQRLRNEGQARQADELEAFARLQRELHMAENNQTKIRLAHESYRENLKAIDDRYAEEELRNAQELAYKAMEIEVQRLENAEMYREAAELRSQLMLQRELDRYEGNFEMIELAYQAHNQRMEAIAIQYADKDARNLAEQVRKEIQQLGNIREQDLTLMQAWLSERMELYADMGKGGELALSELQQFQEQITAEQERRIQEQERLEQRWQEFLVRSRRITQESVLVEQIQALENEIAALADGNERKLQLERELQEARHNLAVERLESQMALLEGETLQEEMQAEERLEILRRIREGYEELYGDLYVMSQEWQRVRSAELQVEKEIEENNRLRRQKEAEARIKEIQYNKDSIQSLNQKRAELLRLIADTDDYIQQQEYLKELEKTDTELDKATRQTKEFFSTLSPELANVKNQLETTLRMINESPQAFENMRYSMQQTFGEYADWVSALYAGMAGFMGAGGTFREPNVAAIFSGIIGAVAGFTGDPVLAAISTGTSMIAKLFDPGDAPREAVVLKENIEALNQALQEFGVAYQSAQLEIREKRFLLWRTGWEVIGEEAAREGYEIGQRILESMNTSLQDLGSVLGSVVTGNATWDDFQNALGNQLRRILLEEIMVSAQFAEQAKLIVGMMQEAVIGGYTEEEIENIKAQWKALLEALMAEWEELAPILEDFFPDEDTTVVHDVRGMSITRLTGQDRELFAELLRPISVLETLPALFDEKLFELYQEIQLAEIGAIHAQEVLIQQVLIQNVTVNFTRQPENVEDLVRELVESALASADGMGLR